MPGQVALIDLTEFALTVDVLPPDANHGEVFTRRWVVDLVLDLVGYTADRDLSTVVALESACGTGAFLVGMADRLGASLRAYGRRLGEAAGSLRAYDLLPGNVRAARRAVVATLVGHGWAVAEAEGIAAGWIRQGDFLLRRHESETVDVVVGNPPYIRLEDVPQVRSDTYRTACPTMGGRADVFVGFYEVALKALKQEGRLGFICADRWMRNAYGRALRGLVTERFAVDAVIVMHDVDAFEEQVSAYPAITILRNGKQGRALVADTTSTFSAEGAGRLVEWTTRNDTASFRRDGVAAAWLPHWFDTDDGWPAGSPERLALVARLEERFPAIEATGAKIGIGLASGADRVYVTTDHEVVEPERLLPMVMRGDLRTGSVQWSGHHLVNPWEATGLVDLSRWPRLRRYFASHDLAVRGRNVARRSPGREHRTIDRVIEGLATTPKLLLADMTDRIRPVLDDGKYYPHHNLYWITSDDWDLRVLGGLLLSDVAELFVSTYCVRMRGGTLRLQAQYLRRIRVPSPSDIDEADAAILRDAFDRRDAAAATAVALRLYGVEAIPG